MRPAAHSLSCPARIAGRKKVSKEGGPTARGLFARANRQLAMLASGGGLCKLAPLKQARPFVRLPLCFSARTDE